MGRLEGKIALITGASRGIGRGIALEFAREGAHVAVNYRRDAAAADATVHAIEELGGTAVALQADVSEWGAVQQMVDAAVQHFGHLDIVVANSGVASRVAPLWDLDVDHWHSSSVGAGTSSSSPPSAPISVRLWARPTTSPRPA